MLFKIVRLQGEGETANHKVLHAFEAKDETALLAKLGDLAPKMHADMALVALDAEALEVLLRASGQREGDVQ